jgi:hypothetical protein
VKRLTFAWFRSGRYPILSPMTWLLLCAPTIANTGPLVRTDYRVLTSDGFQIAVRGIRVAASEPRKTPPIILVHGVRVPGIASFDLPVPGLSGLWRLGSRRRRCHHRRNRRHWFALLAFACSFRPPFVGVCPKGSVNKSWHHPK